MTSLVYSLFKLTHNLIIRIASPKMELCVFDKKKKKDKNKGT